MGEPALSLHPLRTKQVLLLLLEVLLVVELVEVLEEEEVLLELEVLEVDEVEEVLEVEVVEEVEVVLTGLQHHTYVEHISIGGSPAVTQQ